MDEKIIRGQQSVLLIWRKHPSRCSATKYILEYRVTRVTRYKDETFHIAILQKYRILKFLVLDNNLYIYKYFMSKRLRDKKNSVRNDIFP